MKLTAKQLLEQHNGDAMAAAVNVRDTIEAISEHCAFVSWSWLSAYDHGDVYVFRHFVNAVIAHLGENGAERWGAGVDGSA